MTREVKSTTRNGFSHAIAVMLAYLFAAFLKRALEDNFPAIDELSSIMDTGFLVLLFVPFYYLVAKFTDWLYCEDDKSDD